MPRPNVLRAINPRHNPTQATLNRLLKPLRLRLSLARLHGPGSRHAARLPRVPRSRLAVDVQSAAPGSTNRNATLHAARRSDLRHRPQSGGQASRHATEEGHTVAISPSSDNGNATLGRRDPAKRLHQRPRAPGRTPRSLRYVTTSSGVQRYTPLASWTLTSRPLPQSVRLPAGVHSFECRRASGEHHDEVSRPS